MSPKDREKTTFITLWGTFCYKRAMVALFYDMMHREIEVYMDDMIAKSKTLVEHLAYHPVTDHQPLLHEFPDKHIMTAMSTKPQSDEWTMWFDGASNLLGNGIGVVLASPRD
ncbi:hypothetical protein CR513_29214, partial [Mucuna pruriens]